MASTGMWSISEFNLVVDNPAQLPGVVDIAIRTALARRGVAHLSFPNDLQVADANEDPVPARGAGPPAGDRADQGRNFSYLGTHLKRLGSPDFAHLPINARVAG